MMMKLRTIRQVAQAAVIGLAPAAVAVAAPDPPPAAPTPPAVAVPPKASGAGEVPVRERMALEYIRGAQRVLLTSELPTFESLEVARLLLDEAIALTPDDAMLWRQMRSVAELAERDDLRAKAIMQVARLDPEDETVRLLRLNDAIEKYQSAEERIAAYERLLEPSVRDSLGPAVSSRLAMDLALLHRRRGDTDSFARWLSESVMLDSSNRAAVSLAVGYFRMNVSDPFAEAELLASLVQANPVDDMGMVALAQLALEHGAYAGATRMYRLATNVRNANYQFLPDGLLADYAIAIWANGRPDEVIRTIEERQQVADFEARMAVREKDPRQYREDVNKTTGQIGETVCAIRAAIHNRQASDQAATSLTVALNAYATRLRSIRETAASAAAGGAAAGPDTPQPPDPELIARLTLEPVWLAVWLGDNMERVTTMLADVERVMPLSEAARARFQGWIAFKQGRLDDAAQTLAPLAQSDPQAQLGLGLVQIKQGRRSEGAASLLALAQSQTGTLLGVWTEDYLSQLLGARLPQSELGRRLDRLIALLPHALDEYPTDRGGAVGLKVSPVKAEYDAYEPIMVTVELTNKTPFSLAIDNRGPIRPTIVMDTSVRLPRLPNYSSSPSIIVDIDRKLRLEPRQTIKVTVDLRRSELNDIINALPFSGAALQINAYSNFMVSPKGIKMPMMLGTQAQSPVFRVNGARVSLDWIRDTVQEIKQPGSERMLGRMALLGNVLSASDSRSTGDEKRTVTDAAVAQLTDLYARADGLSQAWLISMYPPSAQLEPITAIARKSTDPNVQLCYLMRRVDSRTDPMMDAGKRSENPTVRHIAELIDTVMAQQAILKSKQAAEDEQNKEAAKNAPKSEPMIPPK